MDRVWEFVDSLPSDAEIITAGAPGTDTLAAKYAQKKGLKVKVLFRSDNYSHDPRFFLHRNQSVLEGADEIHVFWDGLSAGTQHAIKLADHLGIPVHIHHVTDAAWETQK
jgi:hypothetical protein